MFRPLARFLTFAGCGAAIVLAAMFAPAGAP
jgi:hypothetical protein